MPKNIRKVEVKLQEDWKFNMTKSYQIYRPFMARPLVPMATSQLPMALVSMNIFQVRKKKRFSCQPVPRCLGRCFIQTTSKIWWQVLSTKLITKCNDVDELSFIIYCSSLITRHHSYASSSSSSSSSSQPPSSSQPWSSPHLSQSFLLCHPMTVLAPVWPLCWVRTCVLLLYYDDIVVGMDFIEQVTVIWIIIQDKLSILVENNLSTLKPAFPVFKNYFEYLFCQPQVLLLLGATVTVAICSEFLVDSIEGVTEEYGLPGQGPRGWKVFFVVFLLKQIGVSVDMHGWCSRWDISEHKKS